MNLKLIVSILVIVAAPVCAQAQKPPKVTKADTQKVIKIISGDKSKMQAYCEMGKLGDQVDAAAQKNDTKKADELNQKMDDLAKKLGPEYNAMMEALQGTDMDSEDGQGIGSTLESLDKLCPK